MTGEFMKKKYTTLLYLLLNVFIIVGIGVFDPHLKDVSQAVRKFELPWIGGAVLCMLLFMLLDALVIQYLVADAAGAKFFLKSVKISILGKYYNAVTPFASGGQPWQIYYMMQSGIPAGFAGSSLTVKFIVYQSVLCLYAIVAFIYKAGFMRGYSHFLFWAALFGFFFNLAGPLIVYTLSVNEGIVKRLIHGCFAFLRKIRLMKNTEKQEKKLLVHMKDFHDSIMLMRGNVRALVVLACISAVEIALLLSIPYFIYKGCGLSGARWLDMVFVHLFLYLAVSFFPTPGAAGASEGGFYVLFNLFFSRDIIFVSMLLWRLISYYFTIIGGGIVILFDSIKRLTKPTLQDI